MVAATLTALADAGDAKIEPLVDLFFHFVRSGKAFRFASFAEHLPYDPLAYAVLAADRFRVDWFRRALGGVVIGRDVLDAGTGDRALLAVLSTKLGARRVVAVDSNRDAVERARAVVRDLGLDRQIELIVGDVREIRCRGRFDVCVAELVGHIGGAEGIWETCSVVGSRLMRPGVEFVPREVQTVMAPCEIPKVRDHPIARRVLSRYRRALLGASRLTSVPVRELLYNLPKTALLGGPGVVEEFQVGGASPRRVERFSGLLTIENRGMFNGVALWTRFRSRGVQCFSTFKGSHWAPVIAHLSEGGALVERGDLVAYTMEIRHRRGLALPRYLLNLTLKRGRQRIISAAVEC